MRGGGRWGADVKGKGKRKGEEEKLEVGCGWLALFVCPRAVWGDMLSTRCQGSSPPPPTEHYNTQMHQDNEGNEESPLKYTVIYEG